MVTGAVAQGNLGFDTSLPNAYITMDFMFSGGQVGDGVILNGLLGELGYLPDGDVPRVVRLLSVDSQWEEVEYAKERKLWKALLEASVEFDTPTPLIVLSPRSSEASRQMNGSFFPSTPEMLRETGFDWLADPDGFELLWDMEGRIAARIARRWQIFGVEEIGALDMTLCVGQSGIIGWARPDHSKRPGPGSIGKFVDDCAKSQLELYTDYRVPQAMREKYGLPTDGPFALVLPWVGYEHVGAAVTLAERTLGTAKAGIAVRKVATETVIDEAGSRFVTRAEHAQLLEGAGITVDSGLSEAMPAWIDSFATQRASLLIFNAEGELIGSYYAFGLVLPDIETLSQGLLRLGLLF